MGDAHKQASIWRRRKCLIAVSRLAADVVGVQGFGVG
jgi:hypothetical protein